MLFGLMLLIFCQISISIFLYSNDFNAILKIYKDSSAGITSTALKPVMFGITLRQVGQFLLLEGVLIQESQQFLQ